MRRNRRNRRLRLGLADRARGRGIAAGRGNNSQIAKPFPKCQVKHKRPRCSGSAALTPASLQTLIHQFGLIPVHVTRLLNGDGRASLITAPGVGGSPSVRVFGGSSPARRFNAFDPTFLGGVWVG